MWASAKCEVLFAKFSALSNSRKFSPVKVSGYTVHNSPQLLFYCCDQAAQASSIMFHCKMDKGSVKGEWD